MIVLTAKHLRLTEASSRSVTVRQKITLWSDFPSYEEFDDATSSDGQPLHFRLGAVFHPLATFFTAGAGCLRWVSIQSNRVSAKNVWQTVFFPSSASFRSSSDANMYAISKLSIPHRALCFDGCYWNCIRPASDCLQTVNQNNQQRVPGIRSSLLPLFCTTAFLIQRLISPQTYELTWTAAVVHLLTLYCCFLK